MKMKPREQISTGLQQMSLPSHVLGDSFVEITGLRQILLCGQKGIRSYSPEEMVVDMTDCGIAISGTELGIVTMTAQELLVRGNIHKVEFLK